MDTIAVVGSGERALALLAALAESRFEVRSVSTQPDALRVTLRRRLPSSVRAEWLSEVHFDCDFASLEPCSIVVETADAPVHAARLAVLRCIEGHVSEGAVLAVCTDDVEALVAGVVRPEQSVALSMVGGRPVVHAGESTAPGALFAVERLLQELEGRTTVTGFPAPKVPSAGSAVA